MDSFERAKSRQMSSRVLDPPLGVAPARLSLISCPSGWCRGKANRDAGVVEGAPTMLQGVEPPEPLVPLDGVLAELFPEVLLKGLDECCLCLVGLRKRLCHRST